MKNRITVNCLPPFTAEPHHRDNRFKITNEKLFYLHVTNVPSIHPFCEIQGSVLCVTVVHSNSGSQVVGRDSNVDLGIV